MRGPFRHPSSRQLFEEVARVFKQEKIFAKVERRMVFVCGGPYGPRFRSVRSRFLRYASTEIPYLHFFRAEDAARSLALHGPPEFVNVGRLEELIAEIAHCILIFPERPGSIAELGFFSKDKGLRKKILIANNLAHQAEDSFINLGPVTLVDSDSVFRPTIHLDYSNPDFLPVKMRLDRLQGQYRQRLKYQPYKKLKFEHRLFVVLELVRIFRAVTLETLGDCLTRVFGKVDEQEIKQLLSLLLGAGYVERKGDDGDHYSMAEKCKPFLTYDNYEIEQLISRVIAYFKQHDPEMTSVLGL